MPLRQNTHGAASPRPHKPAPVTLPPPAEPHASSRIPNWVAGGRFPQPKERGRSCTTPARGGVAPDRRDRLMMLKRSVALCVITAAVTAIVLGPSAAHAYGFSGAAGRLGYASPENLTGAASASRHAAFEKPDSGPRQFPNL